MECTEDAVRGAWLDAKSFISSCQEEIRYCLSDTFLARIYASEPSPLPPAEHARHTPPGEEPELVVLHHTPAVSHVNTKAVCATVAHHEIPRNRTSPSEATLGRRNQSIDSDTATFSPLGAERKGHTPVYDPDSAHDTVTGRRLGDLSATLNTQAQGVGNAMIDIIGRVEDKATLAEMETLASIAGESAKKVTQILMTGQPIQADQAMSDIYMRTTDVSHVKMTRHSDGSNPKSRHATNITNQHTETSTTHMITQKEQQERPVFIPMSSDWCYMASRDTPLVRQAETIKRPAGIYIGPFDDEIAPAKQIANQSKDHNWRWCTGNLGCAEEAVFEENWPHSGAKGKHPTYINKQHRLDESVDVQISKKTDGHRIANNMNNSSRGKFRALHLPEWIPIRDEPDEEPQRPLQ